MMHTIVYTCVLSKHRSIALYIEAKCIIYKNLDIIRFQDVKTKPQVVKQPPNTRSLQQRLQYKVINVWQKKTSAQ